MVEPHEKQKVRRTRIREQFTGARWVFSSTQSQCPKTGLSDNTLAGTSVL